MIFGRVEPGKGAVYGRRMTFDMPNNGGRSNVATYFTKGHLYVLEATVLPANGDFTTPDAGRFLDSLVFDLSHTEPGATELASPNRALHQTPLSSAKGCAVRASGSTETTRRARRWNADARSNGT